MLNHAKVSWITLSICLLLAASASISFAHGIKLFAAVEHEMITGYGYYPGGGKYRDGEITVYGPQKTVLGKTRTDDTGAFSFTARYKCDHIFTIKTHDGHRAQYTVKASALPDSLPELPARRGIGSIQSFDTSNSLAETVEKTSEKPGPAPLKGTSAINTDALKRIIESSVARQMRPLREQLAQYEQKVRLHDILGGIGYILGIAGIAFYVSSRKKTG